MKTKVQRIEKVAEECSPKRGFLLGRKSKMESWMLNLQDGVASWTVQSENSVRRLPLFSCLLRNPECCLDLCRHPSRGPLFWSTLWRGCSLFLLVHSASVRNRGRVLGKNHQQSFKEATGLSLLLVYLFSNLGVEL